jgi:hypothetical protein
MNLGNKLAVGEVHDDLADHGADEPLAEIAPEAAPVRAEPPPEPVVAHAEH